MPRRNEVGERLALFRIAVAEHCTMEEAASRLKDRADAARIETARKAHGEAMRRLYAKGYGRR